ncbi:reverse transcriptase family protein [Pseudochrobactrum asaccharolyticum]|uniref:reverse transcriptase family protein n=1 Tax=Pseudochrobactrum asaccharolyticum TaxID=354351 RepID=UPI00404117FE
MNFANMRLPPQLMENIGFTLVSAQELIEALGVDCDENEKNEIRYLTIQGLPPITSINALSVMIGYNRGFVWSLVYKSYKYYRKFPLSKGTKVRHIEAPKVSLKIIQKWLSYHFTKVAKPHPKVYGFIPRLSHISAAEQHVNAEWIASFDIKNFFQSTPQDTVKDALRNIGYRTEKSIEIISNLCCILGMLAQGAPSSPSLSNMALNSVDLLLENLAKEYGCCFTRYADDIVFSGTGAPPPDISNAIQAIFAKTPWTIATDKTQIVKLPNRLKVHGLLVHGNDVRLTKGYRNKIRLYLYLKKMGYIKDEDKSKIFGHINYNKQIENRRKN